MGRRRKDNSEEIAILAVVTIFVLGAIIVHFAQIIIGIGIIVVSAWLAALCAFGLYRLGQKLWQSHLNVSAWVPDIDWNLPRPAQQGNQDWPKIAYPLLISPPVIMPSNVIGTSGAWKEVVKMQERFPFVFATGPDDLKGKVAVLETAMPELIRQVMAASEEIAGTMQMQAARHSQQVQAIATQYERSIRAKLKGMEAEILEMENGGWACRIRARKIQAKLSDYETEFAFHLSNYRRENEQQIQKIQGMLNPQTREQYYLQLHCDDCF
jgi:hypothetical protein